jgi:glycosyltransferase involved in cell wall biosynthesis
MKNINILGDTNNSKFRSSDIIISNINSAAKKLGIFSEDGYKIVYDCIGNTHGHNPDAMIIVYELIFPHFIFKNIHPKPILGVSRDNLNFILESGYPPHLCDYVHLGVDSSIWSFREKKTQDKFTLLGIGESNSRGGLEFIVQNFCEQFKNSKSVRLYLRDREAGDIFKSWVKEKSIEFNVEIIHDDRHLENFEEEKEIYYKADAAICLNKTSTWNLRTIECMSTGTPLIVIPYAGPRDYTINNFSALHVDFDLCPFTEQDIFDAQKLGLRNHLFHPSIHPKTPYWSIPKNESIKLTMQEMVENSNLRNFISHYGSITSQKFSWEKCAINIYHIINSILNK